MTQGADHDHLVAEVTTAFEALAVSQENLEEAKDAEAAARRELNEALLRFAEHLQANTEAPPPGFTESLYWDFPGVYVSTIAAFTGDSVSAVHKRFPPTNREYLCRRCGVTFTVALKNRTSATGIKRICAGCEAEGLAALGRHMRERSRQDHASIVRALLTGLEVPPAHPDTIMQVATEDGRNPYISTVDLADLAREVHGS